MERTISVTSGTREWADSNINCILGCHNNCRYCYAKIMAKRFRRATDETWPLMRIREEITKKKFRRFSGRVMFPSSHDIVDIPLVRKACFETLGNLLQGGNQVLVTTKPSFSIIKKMDKLFSDFKKNLQFRFTITSIDNNLLHFWEPNAPLFEERMASLRYAFERNYKTSVSIEPYLDESPMPLVSMVTPLSTESIWIGKMNYIPLLKNVEPNVRYFYEHIRKIYEINHLIKIYKNLLNRPKIRFKDSILFTLRRHRYF